MATFPCLERVDWGLLHAQKRFLTGRLEELEPGPVRDVFQGLVNFLDALQDDAAAAGLWTFPGEDAPSGGAH